MKFTIAYTRTLTLEETFEAASKQEAERYAEVRAWESCELLNRDFDTSETEFSVEEVAATCNSGCISMTEGDKEHRLMANMPRPTIVCLCGSTRFSQAYREANLRETLAGKIVLSIGIDTKSDSDLLLAGELTPVDKDRLDELHLRKIDLADEVLILNVGGYVGQSTQREICYAQRAGKTIRWLEEQPL